MNTIYIVKSPYRIKVLLADVHSYLALGWSIDPAQEPTVFLGYREVPIELDFVKENAR